MGNKNTNAGLSQNHRYGFACLSPVFPTVLGNLQIWRKQLLKTRPFNVRLSRVPEDFMGPACGERSKSGAAPAACCSLSTPKSSERFPRKREAVPAWFGRRTSAICVPLPQQTLTQPKTRKHTTPSQTHAQIHNASTNKHKQKTQTETQVLNANTKQKHKHRQQRA